MYFYLGVFILGIGFHHGLLGFKLNYQPSSTNSSNLTSPNLNFLQPPSSIDACFF